MGTYSGKLSGIVIEPLIQPQNRDLALRTLKRLVTLVSSVDYAFYPIFSDLAENDVYDYKLNGTDLSFWDPRQVKFGKRTLKPIENVISASLEDYTDARYQIGIAEGSNEIEFGKSFPLEYNLGRWLKSSSRKF